MGIDRRAAERIQFDGKAYLTYNGRCRCEDVVDVSTDGLLLRSDVRLRPGKPVKVFLPLRLGEVWRLCLLKGRVVRRVRGKGTGGLGIALDAGEMDTRGLLAAFVAGIA